MRHASGYRNLARSMALDDWDLCFHRSIPRDIIAKMGRQRRILLLAVTACLLCFVSALLWIRTNTPQDMLPDRFKASALVGKDKAEIVRLLGKPQDGDMKTDRFYYRVGDGSGYMPIGDRWAVIHFQNDRVASVTQERD